MKFAARDVHPGATHEVLRLPVVRVGRSFPANRHMCCHDVPTSLARPFPPWISHACRRCFEKPRIQEMIR
eukprot:symbB.v1.2.033963.t1/scaffold4299.1/size41683/2